MLGQVHVHDAERVYRSYPHQLSGGQRQRIMIAMALILRPKLLIADEATTALDVSTQSQILSLIRELQEKQGTGVMLITHDMGIVADIATDVAVMRAGRVVEAGSKEEVLGRPRHEYTRKLLAAVPSLTPRTPRPPVSGPPVLEVRSLTKTYVHKALLRPVVCLRAVQNVSLTVPAGRTVGVVGESGSGKSTLARSLMGLVKADGGDISLAGQQINGRLHSGDDRSLCRRMQIVFQDPYRSLNPRLRVGESVIEGAVNFGMGRSEALGKAEHLFDMVQLSSDTLMRFPHQFSGGQRQRIAIARALMLDPQVLICDEAVSALDVSVQSQTLELLDTIQSNLSLGMIFITHDLRVAARICDQILVMRNGRVVEHGPVQDIMEAPRNEYTKQLIEATPGRGWDFGRYGRSPSA